MLRWMKKGNDVLLLQGKQEGGDRERGGEEEGWRRKRFVRFGASPPARSLDSGADCALGEMSPCTILRRRPKYVAQTGYTPLRSYILSDAHNESNSCAVHSSLSKGGREEGETTTRRARGVRDRERQRRAGRGTKFGERRKRGTMENFNFTFHLKSSTFVVRRDSLRGRTARHEKQAPLS